MIFIYDTCVPYKAKSMKNQNVMKDMKHTTTIPKTMKDDKIRCIVIIYKREFQHVQQCM